MRYDPLHRARRGHRGTHTADLTWEDGQLWGDPDAVAMVQRLAEAHDGVLFVFRGGVPSSRYHLLHNPWAARELMCIVFWGLPRQIEGALPKLSGPPPGASQ